MAAGRSTLRCDMTGNSVYRECGPADLIVSSSEYVLSREVAGRTALGHNTWYQSDQSKHIPAVQRNIRDRLACNYLAKRGGLRLHDGRLRADDNLLVYRAHFHGDISTRRLVDLHDNRVTQVVLEAGALDIQFVVPGQQGEKLIATRGVRSRVVTFIGCVICNSYSSSSYSRTGGVGHGPNNRSEIILAEG
jgi:hypothetical protein